MQETDMKEKLQKIIEAYDELQAKMGDPAVLADQKEYNRLAKEYASQGARSPRRQPSTWRPWTIWKRPRRCSPTPT